MPFTSNAIAAITPRQQAALNLYSALFQFCMFFCGYSIPVSEVPWYWKWATDVSFARYSFECFILNEFSGEDNDETTYWLDYWGFNGANKWSIYGYFVLSVAFFHLLAWAAMAFVSFDRR